MLSEAKALGRRIRGDHGCDSVELGRVALAELGAVNGECVLVVDARGSLLRGELDGSLVRCRAPISGTAVLVRRRRNTIGAEPRECGECGESRGMQALPALMLVSEVAAELRVDPATVHRWIADGRLPSIRIGKTLRIGRAAVDMLLQQATGATNMVVDGGMTTAAASKVGR